MPSPAAAKSKLYAQVVFNLPLDISFTYLVDDCQRGDIAVGKRVLAPFRNRVQSGYLVALTTELPELKKDIVLQKLTAVIDSEPLFNPEQLKFYLRAADYYQAAPGEALFALLPGGLQYRQVKVISLNRELTDQAAARKPSPLLQELMSLLQNAGNSLTLPEIAAQISDTVPLSRLKPRLARWEKSGWIKSEERLLLPPVKAQFELICEITAKTEIIAAISSSRIRKEKQRQLIDFINAGGFFSRRRFTKTFSGGITLIKRWQEAGWLEIAKVPKLRALTEDDDIPLGPMPEAVLLTPAQKKIFDAIKPQLKLQKFAPFLLHGVTGSGKTEIYIKLIAKVIDRGAGAIYLVPEIALTIELVDRLVHEFGSRTAVLHSGLSNGERYDQWRRIAAGEAEIVVGARSAIFAPLKKPGLIIVDEEHEPSYKQDSGFAYNGRDLALLRGQMADCCVVLGSATPSLISYHNAINKRYQLLSLPERLDRKMMPKVEIVDLNKEKNMFAWDGFSPRLRERMAAVFAKDRQVMLFLNKRGFSRTLYCLNCGYMPDCRLCSVHLTFHKNLDLLVCHYCGGRQPLLTTCPECGGQRFFPLGIGIQKLEEGLSKHFPEIKVLRLDRDATRRKGELSRIIGEFRAGKAQVLLGTQMLAKGHNFPGVDLVGVIFADLSLEMPEFTAPERTFQLLAQVAGRAGRGRDDNPGEVIVQTLQPDHYSVLTATTHDYEAFYQQEIQNRSELGFPPFSYLANLRANGPDQEQVRNFLQQAKTLGQEILGTNKPAPRPESNLDNETTDLDEPDFSLPPIALLGPVPAAIVKVQNRYRWSLLLKAHNRRELHSFIRRWRRLLPTSTTLKWRLDIDPLSFF